MVYFAQNLTRREFLGATGALGGSLAAATLLGASPATAAAAAKSKAPKVTHLAWVWQFNDDGSPEEIVHTLAQNNLGVIIKTHDGTTWMGKWDKSPLAITGTHALESVMRIFEDGGVPVHAWGVTRGKDPIGEAQMAAEVLGVGVRSFVFDLEPEDDGHYWVGEPDDANRIGEELRRLRPSARIVVAPDPRPWQLQAVPIGEFASFSDEIAPQTYWNTFDSSANYRLLRQHGFETPNGVTPELILDVSRSSLERYGKPIRPVGQGAANADDWRRFVGHAYELGMEHVSVWRYRTARDEIWPVLRDMSPKQPPEPEPIIVNPPPAEAASSNPEDGTKKDDKGGTSVPATPSFTNWLGAMRTGLRFFR